MSFIFHKVFNGNYKRGITSTALLYDKSTPSTGHVHRVNNFERRILVWTGKYKTIEDVPGSVAPEVMERARSRMRIRVANWMMALTLVGCGVMIYLGKQSHKSGDSLTKRNLEMHRLYTEHENKAEK